MDKQKQIDEMARTLTTCERNSCVGCGMECIDYRMAKSLYNAGYRKIPENAVVVPDMEGKDFYTVEKSEWDKMVQGAKGIIREREEKARKETAEKFAEQTPEKITEFLEEKLKHDDFVNGKTALIEFTVAIAKHIADEICKEIIGEEK